MSKIEWTGETWNPVIGCDKVSEGCKNCYAIKTAWIRQHNPAMAEKYAGVVKKTANGQLNWTGQINTSNKALLKPLQTKKATTYFVNSMSDLFHDKIPFEFIDALFAIMALCQQHTFQILTKRPKRMIEYFERHSEAWLADIMASYDGSNYTLPAWPLQNVWIGVSVENQKAADERIPLLVQVPAAVRFLSCEPLLGPVDLFLLYNNKTIMKDLHWVICGGESGKNARPMHPKWARQLKDQCRDYNIPFFYKQNGEYVRVPVPVPGSKTILMDGEFLMKAGKKKAGRLLDGREWNEMPMAKV